MRHSVIRRVPALVVGLGLVFGVAGCGGGGHGGGGGGGGGGSPITGVSPSTFDSEISTPVVLTGSGFTPISGPAAVHIVAEAGTPFLGGTSADVTIPGTIDSFTQVSFNSIALGATGSIAAHVRVVLPSLATLDSAANSVTVVGPKFTSITPSSLPPISSTPFVVHGAGFGPVGAAASVKFTCTAGTRFAAGTSAVAIVVGTVASATTITATSPTALPAPFLTTVAVTLPSGASAALPGTFPFAPAGGGGAGLVITTDAPGTPAVVRAYLGQETTFHVTATEASALVSLRLLNPPAGLELQEVSALPSPQTVTVRWQVPLGARLGETPLFFESNDNITPSLLTRLTVWVDVQPTQAVRVADVTGDGRDDFIAAASLADPAGTIDAGTIYVFAGGTSPSGSPTAVLTVPGAIAADKLGASDVPFLVGDVNADGKLDIVASAPNADVAGTVDAGAIYVWFGGSGLTGAKSPDATLVVPGAIALDGLRLRLLADVSGDGTLDVIGGSALADAGAVNSGAVYVWKGGAGMTGARPADATLVVTVPAATANDGIGSLVRAADFTGDGILDVITWSSNVTITALPAVGAVYVWKGGATLTGTVPADFTLTKAPGATALDQIGLAVENNATDAVRLADVTGDGILDVVAVAYLADVGAFVNAGAIYVWRGGAAPPGLRPPDATLTAAAPVANDQLGLSGLYIADVTGAATLDVIPFSRLIDFAAVDSGGGYVWAGGAGLTGLPPPAATLRVATAHPAEGLAAGNGNVRIADVTGDGKLDVIANAFESDHGSMVVVGVGEVALWFGGGTLAGVKPPDATMSIAGAFNLDHLGKNGALLVGDVSGDGTLDVVVATPDADTLANADPGAIFVFRGGAGLAGAKTEDARLAVASPTNNDALGFSDAAVGGSQTGATLADVSGDGVLDVVGRAQKADLGLADVGAFYVWRGGAGLTGPKPPDATLTVPSPTAGDMLGGRVGFGTRVLDVTGDGTADVVALSTQTTVSSIAGAGCGFVWNGGAALLGAKSPDSTLRRVSPSPGEKLGSSSLLLADLTADGTLDVLIGSTILAPSNRGGVVLFGGGAGLAGTPAPKAVFQDPGGTAGDALGQ